MPQKACYIENMKEIVTDSCSFEDLITAGDIIYVDKTAYVQKMVMSRSRFFFISRPRRFGKSLMCSTLDALFSGKKELFKDLYIGKTDYDFNHTLFSASTSQGSRQTHMRVSWATSVSRYRRKPGRMTSSSKRKTFPCCGRGRSPLLIAQ